MIYLILQLGSRTVVMLKEIVAHTHLSDIIRAGRVGERQCFDRIASARLRFARMDANTRVYQK